MSLRVAYGSQYGIQNALVNNKLPENTILIARVNQMAAELSYLDNNKELLKIVPQTVFDSQNNALTYALENNISGCLISILSNGRYKPYIAQDDYNFSQLVTTDDIAGRLDLLESSSHSHYNKTILDLITEERVQRWDSNVDSVINIIKINGLSLSHEDGIVDIPLATTLNYGVVKSSTEENHVSVTDNGTMTINSLNITKLVQNDGDILLFMCGKSNI